MPYHNLTAIARLSHDKKKSSCVAQMSAALWLRREGIRIVDELVRVDVGGRGLDEDPLSAGDYLGKGVNEMSQAMRRNMTNAIAVMPIPQKYVDTAAKGMRSAALKAVNEPARQGRWAVRSVYKGCKKFMYGKDKYRRLKKEKLTR